MTSRDWRSGSANSFPVSSRLKFTDRASTGGRVSAVVCSQPWGSLWASKAL